MAGSRSPIASGLACRCPRCGRGRLFRGYIKVAEKCESCGLDFSGGDTGDGPAAFMVLIIGAFAVPLVLWVEFHFEPPFWLHLILWPPVVLGATLLLLRPLKGVMVALQLHHKAGDDRH